jgi:hypothetical protein
LRYTKCVPPCYHSHLFINLRYTKGCRYVPPCYHSHLFIICVEGALRPSVLSFASVHNCVTRRCVTSSVHSSVHNLRYTKVPLRPSVLSFHLFMLRYTKGSFSPSVLSFASVHKFALHEGPLPPLVVLSFASVHKVCVTRGARPSVLSFASVHNLRCYEGARPPCYHSHLFIIALRRGPSVPPCYHSHLFIKFALHEGAVTSSVLSFASVHNLRFTRRGHVPPCYHSHLFINLRYEGTSSVLSFASVHKCVTRRGTSLRAIIRICS